jgi:hypothetical protein
MTTLRISGTAVRADAAARLRALLGLCVRDYRRMTLDCPLAAGIVAEHRHRRRARRAAIDQTIRRIVRGTPLTVDPIYLEAAAACCRAGGPDNCPMRRTRP